MTTAAAPHGCVTLYIVPVGSKRRCASAGSPSLKPQHARPPLAAALWLRSGRWLSQRPGLHQQVLLVLQLVPNSDLQVL